MTKLKRILALFLVVVITAALAINGTVAYLTDRDSDANVFTIGEVSIELNENYQQGAELIPGVKIEKKPTVTNTGKNDAWIWVDIAIPAALDHDNASMNAMHFNYDGAHVNKDEWTWKDDAGNWLVEKNVDIRGKFYNVYTVLYQSPVKAGEATSDVMTQVYLDSRVDIAPDGQWYKVANGETTKIDWNTNEDATPIMYVSAYGIQYDGFASVQDAYKAYSDQWNKGDKEWAEVPGMIYTAEDMKKALNDGGEWILANDITTEGNISFGVPSGVSATLHLNNSTIDNPRQAAAAITNSGILTINGNGNVKNEIYSISVRNNTAGILYINGGTMIPYDENGAAVYNYGTAIINGGEFTEEVRNVFRCDEANAKLTVNNVTVNCVVKRAIEATENSEAVINGGTYNVKGTMFFTNTGAKIVVNGGKFHVDGKIAGTANGGMVIINGGTFNQDPTAWLGTGHTATKDETTGIWTVK